MDPRLKAYQKQTRSPTPESAKAAQFPRFDIPAEASPPLIKTVVAETEKKPDKKKVLGDKSLRKVAKFLILLGQDEAAKVVRHLDPSQIEALGQEIAGIKSIEPVEAEAILKEFGYIAQTQAASVKGGKVTAEAILNQAFGGERAKSILHKVVPQASERPFAFFSGLEPEVVAALLRPESAQVLSVVVPFLEKAQAAVFLKTLDAGQRLDLVKRLAKMERVPSAVVAQVDQALRERFHTLKPANNTDTVDGKARLADILRHMSVENESAILKSFEGPQPGLSEDLRRRMFTSADLVRVADDGFEELLRAKDDSQVALLWLAGDEALQLKIRTNISARRLLLVQAEVDLLSDTPKRELQKELRFFLDEVRQAVREGKAVLFDDNEEYL